MRRSVRGFFYYGSISALSVLCPYFPRLAFTIAGLLGRVGYRFLRRNLPEDIRLVFPALSEAQARNTAGAMRSLEAKTLLFDWCLRRSGYEGIKPVVRSDEQFSRMQAPAILAFFHIGAFLGVGAILDQLNAPILALRRGFLVDKPYVDIRVEDTGVDEQYRARIFLRSLEELRRGHFLVSALDVVPAATISVPCIGSRLTLSRGPFVLSRLTGAPIFPIIARWEGTSVRIMVGEPFPTNVSEEEMAAAAARCLEAHVTRWPADLQGVLFESMLAGVNRAG